MYDVVVIGAGAAGLMAAWIAGTHGARVALLEHTGKIGEKIRISGGGRCNFTNLHAGPQNYLSENPHYAKSALAGYTQRDFIALVERHGIVYHEKTLGQLFCDGSSKQIITMLVDLCRANGVEIRLNCSVDDIEQGEMFMTHTSSGVIRSHRLVVACGGLSIPQIGASDFGYRMAKKFGHKIIPTRPALVPLTVGDKNRSLCTDLSGVALMTKACYKRTNFRENSLFTHRGLSGPAILQISSYLEGFNDQEIHLDLSPDESLETFFSENRTSKQLLHTVLRTRLPNRLVDHLSERYQSLGRPLNEIKKQDLQVLVHDLHRFKVLVNGSDGYQKAEVTRGGVDTRELNSKTMESKKVPGLYFIGEVVDVTGWLGGYNFQWAWSSGFAAGNAAGIGLE